MVGRDVALQPVLGGTVGTVLAAIDDRGTPVAAIKHVPSKGAWIREIDALRRCDGLAGACPRVLGGYADLRAIAMTWLPGAVVTTLRDAPLQLWREAGALRRSLDAVLPPIDPLPLERAVQQRFTAWLARARTVLPSATCDAIAARADASAFAGRSRRLCHRDFGPHNWLVDGPLRFVDLGHARADDPLVDLVHATVPPWDTTAHVDAFATGWGIALDDTTWRCIRELALLHGLATTTWGHMHRAARFVALGDAIITRSIDPLSRWYVAEVG